MALIWKGILALIWLVIVPGCSGVLFLRKKAIYTLAESYLAGYLFLFALAELLTVPFLFLDLPLHLLVLCYGTITALAALAGIFRIKKYGIRNLLPTGSGIRSTSFYFWAAVILILMQVGVVVLFAHFDADDALYVAAATTAVEEDSIFHVNAYTGIPYVNLPRRYILSPFPMFLAVISQLCGGLHPAIMAHTIFPAVFLPSCYLVLYQIGKRWFPDRKESQGIFLLLSAVLLWFSAYSVYNAGNFQMVRLWQGKSLLASFLLPLVFYLSLSIVLEEKPKYSWLLYGLANISGCLLSSMGIILTPLMMGIFIFWGLLKFKSLKRTALGLICCLPSVILGAAYVLILLLRGRGII